MRSRITLFELLLPQQHSTARLKRLTSSTTIGAESELNHLSTLVIGTRLSYSTQVLNAKGVATTLRSQPEYSTTVVPLHGLLTLLYTALSPLFMVCAAEQRYGDPGDMISCSVL